MSTQTHLARSSGTLGGRYHPDVWTSPRALLPSSAWWFTPYPALGIQPIRLGHLSNPAVGVCAFPPAIPKAKFPWGFFSWSSTSLAFKSPCNTRLFLHAWKSVFPRSCAGETVVFNAIHSHSLIAHVPISSRHWAMFCLNRGVTCRASPLSTSKMWAVPTVPEDSVFKDIPSSLSLSSSLVWVASSPGHQLGLFIQVS